MFDVVASQLTGAFLPDWEQQLAYLARESAAPRPRGKERLSGGRRYSAATIWRRCGWLASFTRRRDLSPRQRPAVCMPAARRRGAATQ